MITNRIDNITAIKTFTAHQPYPESVKIELTSACNYKCTFCAHTVSTKKKGMMNRQLFTKILLDLRECGVREIGLFYIGEPFLCSWLPDAIREVKDMGFEYVFLTTNGSIATPDKVEPCMAAGLDSLKFSLNYASPEQFVDIAGVKSQYFDAIIDNIKSARKVRDAGGYHCQIYASSIKYENTQLEQMENIISDILPYVDQHYWLPLYSMAGHSTISFRTIVGNTGRLDNPRPPLPCWSVFTEGHITYDGKVSACCFDASDSWIMGDVTIDTFAEIWNNPKFTNLRERHLSKDIKGTPCEQCIVAR